MGEEGAKVSLCGDDDPILVRGERHDPGVRCTRRSQVADMYSVMPGRGQELGKAG